MKQWQFHYLYKSTWSWLLPLWPRAYSTASDTLFSLHYNASPNHTRRSFKGPPRKGAASYGRPRGALIDIPIGCSHREKRSNRTLGIKLLIDASIPQTIRWNCVKTKRRGRMIPYNLVAELQKEGKRRRHVTQRAVLQR